MQVRVAQFEGPLDLLLNLIEEQKLDITQISLAQVTQQFLEHMRSQTHLGPRELADWLVIAAKLLVIKSKALVPSLELAPEEEEDATNLAWQLYQFKRYKKAAHFLQTLDQKRRQGWSRVAAFSEKIAFYPDPTANPASLRDAMRALAKSLEQIAALPKKILEEVVTISEKIEFLQNLLAEKLELRLRDLLAASQSKTEVIVTFLALLELVKQRILSVEQEAIFSEIIIKKQPPLHLPLDKGEKERE